MNVARTVTSWDGIMKVRVLPVLARAMVTLSEPVRCIVIVSGS
jgi:hypothetical protein